MHELSIVHGVVGIVEERAKGRRVKAVRMRIGDLAGIEIDAVRFCFDVCTNGTSVEGARLDIDRVVGRGRCCACGQEREVKDRVFLCPCGGPGGMELVSGDELSVVSMEVDDV